MKTLPLLFIMVCLWLAVVSPSAGQTPDEQEIQAIARQGLVSFTSLIPPGSEHDYGFHDRSEIKRALVGVPCQMYTIHPDVLLKGGVTTTEYLTPTGEWRVPVIVDGKYRCLLSVAKTAGTWQVVKLGAAQLARELFARDTLLQLEKARRILLRIFQLESDFLLLCDSTETLDHALASPIELKNNQTPDSTILLPPPIPIIQLIPLLRERYTELINSHHEPGEER